MPTIPPSSIDPAALSNAIGLKLPAMMGRYRIDKELGRGAMGAVYLAHDSELDRPVALKIPKFSGQENPDLIARFLREARSAAVLAHPNICRVYDVSEHQGVRYIAMEYIEGKPLSSFIAAKNVQPKQAATVIRKLAQGLAEAHQRGILHRDLKPDNILVNKNGEPVLTDFGLARESAKGNAAATQDGVILGSPAYMPPEQAAGNLSDMGPTSDIYSLGVVLYELLTGDVPFRGSVVEVLASVLMKAPKTVREAKPDVDPGLAAICDKMMSKKAADRQQSMNEVAQALGEWLKNPQASIAPAKPVAPGLAASGEFKLQPKFPNSQTINPSSTKTPGAKQTMAPGKKAAPERTPQQLKELGDLVNQLLARNDYLEAIHILEDIPDYQRTPQLRMLLGEAFELKGTVEKLERQLEKWLNQVDLPELKKTIDKLLKIHPSHPRGKELKKAMSQYGKRGIITILKEEGNYHGGGFALEPWQIGAALSTLLAIFAAVSYAVFLYIKVNTGLVEIEIDDPTAVVKIDGNAATITGEGTGEVRLKLGPHDYTVEKDGLTVVTSKSFQVAKDGKNVLKISLKDEKEAAAAKQTTPVKLKPSESSTSNGPPLAIAPFTADQAKAHQEAWAKHFGVPVEYTNSLGMKFRLIPPGDFLMGSPESDPEGKTAEKPQHKVRLTKPYYLGTTEVTQTLWSDLMDTTPWKGQPGEPKEKNAPASSITYNEAVDFCSKLVAKEAGQPKYRLPTEAEWEFAHRAGTTTRYATGDDTSALHDHAWNRYAIEQGGPRTPRPVGTKPPNPFGVYDMTGNVWEWTSDWYDQDYYANSPAEDPTGPASGSEKSLRGGAYDDVREESYRCARRDHADATHRSDAMGFRVMLPIDGVKQTTNQQPTATVMYLNELKETSVEFWQYKPNWGFNTNGFIGLRDESNPEQRIVLEGKPSPHGIFCHAKPNGISSVKYDIGGLGYQKFQADAGIADYRMAGPTTPHTFEVYGDGKLLWKSPTVDRWGKAHNTGIVKVSGVKELELRVNCPGDAGWGIAVWCEPRLFNGSSDEASVSEGPPAAVAPFNADRAKAHQEAWAKHLGLPTEFTNTIGMKFRLIPPGEFQMGSKSPKPGAQQSPAYRVRLTQPFYLGTYEVQQSEYERVTGTNPSHFSKKGADAKLVRRELTETFPVDGVSWDDSVEFCEKLSDLENVASAYRLPTAAEWEYACQAGAETPYWYGVSPENAKDFGWCVINSGKRPHPVGQLQANPFGVYDILGNGWEWVSDWYSETYHQQFQNQIAVDPTGASAGEKRMTKGGSWFSAPAFLETASCSPTPQNYRSNSMGLRLLLRVDVVQGFVNSRSDD